MVSSGGDGLGCKQSVGRDEYTVCREGWIYARCWGAEEAVCFVHLHQAVNVQAILSNTELVQYMQNQFVMIEYLVSLFRLVHFITS